MWAENTGSAWRKQRLSSKEFYPSHPDLVWGSPRPIRCVRVDSPLVTPSQTPDVDSDETTKNTTRKSGNISE